MQPKLIPILFSTPMVQAILDNRKTMTRRTKGLDKFNENPDRFRYDGIDEEDPNIHWFEVIDENGNPTEDYQSITCPYSKVGDVLWVRETFNDDHKGFPVYKADVTENLSEFINKGIKWKPSLFMPKDACRIFLRITDVRVERLKKITDDDAIKEGIEFYHQKVGMPRYRDYMPSKSNGDDLPYPTVGVPACSFSTLWESINGEQSWNANPFVWVVSFERCEKPTI